MFLPIRDAPNPPGVPVVNYALIALNVIVYLAITVPLGAAPADPNNPLFVEYREMLRGMVGTGGALPPISAYDLVVYEYGYRPAEGSIVAMFASMFLHGGFMHLAGNMLFLWIYGDNVEARLGKLLYPVAYLATGVAAVLLHAAFDSDSNVPMVGASGAISGVLGFYFLFFPKNVVHVFIVFFPFFMNVVTIPARFVLGIYLVLDNILPFIMQGGLGGPGVAYGAHIGGFIAGLAGAAMLGGRWVHGPVDEVLPPRDAHAGAEGTMFPGGAAGGLVGGASPEKTIATFVQRGRLDKAAEVYFSAPEGTIAPAPGDTLEIGRWLAENDNPGAALNVFERLLARFPTGETAAWAHLGAGYVQAQFLDSPTAAYRNFLDAGNIDAHGEAGQRARAAMAQMDRSR